MSNLSSMTNWFSIDFLFLDHRPIGEGKKWKSFELTLIIIYSFKWLNWIDNEYKIVQLGVKIRRKIFDLKGPVSA